MMLDNGVLQLDGELGIYLAAELKPLLLGSGIHALDLSAVELLDTAGVQLLLLAVRAAQEEGRTLRVSAASQPVRAVIALLGLESRLGLEPAP